jgi:hypothetical protein
MGGPNSGNRWPRVRKTTVEESLALAMSQLRPHLVAGTAGTLTWTFTSGGKASVGFAVAVGDGGPVVTLQYCRGRESVEEIVRLSATVPGFGGRRLWLLCPDCGGRCGKLFLPPGGPRFGCRTCRGLAYTSSQEAHQTERVFARHLGYDAESARLLASGWHRRYRRPR